MLEMTIRAEGEKATKAMLKKAPIVIRKHLKRGMGKSVFGVERIAKIYPPPPPDSRYRRTGTLGRKWKSSVKSITGGVRGIVQNPVPYAPVVQGENQAAIHRGRWKPMSQIIKELGPKIAEYLEEALRLAIKELEGYAR